MTRRIIGLKKDAYSYLVDFIPRAIASESIYEEAGVADIELSEAVIIKSYNNGIILDLGCKRVTLEALDFSTIIILAVKL